MKDQNSTTEEFNNPSANTLDTSESHKERWTQKCLHTLKDGYIRLLLTLKKQTAPVDMDTHWNLIPLTPEYDEKEHRCYVNTINKALKNEKVRNIALSGSYGVGKSSILQEVANSQQKRVVELSLSTLAPIEGDVEDESVPKQATTTTNRIQQEIVKQLLYREDPSKTPDSRFRRIERFSLRHELKVACLLGFVASLIFLLTGWTQLAANRVAPQLDLGLWPHLIALVLSGSIILALRRLLHGRIHISQVSTGAATVTLDDKSVSYFDQYLDEIVYFFEVSKRDIVIFEDIDRFNDAHIFETLRALNTLLNVSPQTDRPIRFIYAIKDSIFDRIGLNAQGREPDKGYEDISDAAQAEVVRANRTKFFDLVIPVVPFITHLNAKSLAHEHLDEIEHNIDPKLIDLAAKFVPDMRLLKNTRNEFVVFRDRIFSGDGQLLKLSETELFAMMLYKCTHLADFEAIRINKSKLDRLYEVWRNLVTVNIQGTQRKIRSIQNSLRRLDSVTTQSTKLGNLLIEHVKRTLRAISWDHTNGQYRFNGKTWRNEDLGTTEFWTEYVLANGDPEIQWHSTRQTGRQLQFSRSDLEGALGTSLKPEEWNKADRDELKHAFTTLQENLKLLNSADMGDLIKRPDFKVTYDGDEQSLAAIAQDILSSELAFQLAQAGYINRNFTLYTSTFHGNRVSPAATNFIIHHVQRSIMDEHFSLDDNDVKAVIREVGEDALAEPALYNIAILDHLLREDSTETADILIRSLIQLGDDQKRFMQAYLGGAEKRLKFVERFTGFSADALKYLITQVELEDSDRLLLVSDALQSLSDKNEYRTGPEVSQYLSENYAELPALTAASGNSGAELIAKVFTEADIRVPDIAPLSETTRRAFIANSLYQVNKENLGIVFGNDTDMSLNSAIERDKRIYSYLIKNLVEYLSAVEGISATVTAKHHFIKIIEDVLEDNAEYLGEVISHASTSCIVTAIEEVSEQAWPILAQHTRFPATFNNISHYITSIGSIDGNLARVLTTAGEISEHKAIEEESKTKLAVKILSASEHVSSASLRAELVASLDLEHYLNVGAIPLEEGELFAQLLEKKIIKDSAETYGHLLDADWPTRELFIHESKEFKEYVAADLINGDIAPLLLSNKIDNAIKIAVADLASDNPEICNREDLAQLANFAMTKEQCLTIDVIEKMAHNGVPTPHVVYLLQPHLISVSREQLFRILEALDGDYPKLTYVGAEQPKIPNTPADRELLDVLQSHGIVSRFAPDTDPIKVNKRRKLS